MIFIAISEKARVFYIEIALLQEYVSGCDLGVDNTN